MALSFWITLVAIDNFLTYDSEPTQGQTIVCHIPIGSSLPANKEPLPLLVVGDPGKSDIFYLMSQGDKVLLGTDGWGLGRKEAAVETAGLTDATLDIVLNYSKNEKAIRLKKRSILQASGQLASTFDQAKIFIGQNAINYPGFSSSYPEIVALAQAGRATCNTNNG